MVTYIPYPKAIKSLVDRFNATPEELAAWIWMAPKNNGLAAYLNANGLESPPRFFYDDAFCSKDSDYISPLMACWFNADDIANFKPVDRYITGAALIERWESQPNIQPKGFIQAKIEEARLSDFHPLYGGTQASSPEGNFPPLESGLFLISEIERIETKELSPYIDDFSEKNIKPKASCDDVKNSDLLAPFKEINDLRFSEIKITIDPESMGLQISAKKRVLNVSFASIGLTKRNGITLNKSGEVFMALGNGSFSPGAPGASKAITRLSKNLRDAFETSDTPFLKGKPQFNLSVPKDNEAKRRALKRTTSYDDRVATKSSTNADDFLKNHDPEFDPNNPTYTNVNDS